MKINRSTGNSFLILILSLFFFAACKKDESPKKPLINLAPASFEISITDLQPKSVTLSWTEAKDPEGKQVMYSVAVGEDTINRFAERNVILNDLEENKNYEVTVIAKDPEGETSKKNISFTTTEYSAPSAFEISMQNVGGTVASLSWTSSTLPDNSPVLYDVYLNDELVQANLASTVFHFEFSKLQELTSYTAKVIAKSSFNKTTQSTKSFITAADPAPTGLSVQVKLVSYSLAKISIGAATDPEGQVIDYAVFLDNGDISAQLDTDIAAGKDYTVRSLLPEKTYTLTVRATDESGKKIEVESSLITLKQPTLVISNKSIVKTTDGFIYNLETNVDYKPDHIILYANGIEITTQPTASSVINQNTISYTYLNSYLPAEGSYSIAANLFWGDVTEKSRTATFNSYAFYTYVPGSSTVSDAKIDAASPNIYPDKTYNIFFQNSVISSDPNYSIIEVVFGNVNVQHSVYRTGDKTGYITGFISGTQFQTIDAGPKTGYLVIKDNAGYHKLNFTFSYF